MATKRIIQAPTVNNSGQITGSNSKTYVTTNTFTPGIATSSSGGPTDNGGSYVTTNGITNTAGNTIAGDTTTVVKDSSGNVLSQYSGQYIPQISTTSATKGNTNNGGNITTYLPKNSTNNSFSQTNYQGQTNIGQNNPLKSFKKPDPAIPNANNKILNPLKANGNKPSQKQIGTNIDGSPIYESANPLKNDSVLQKDTIISSDPLEGLPDYAKNAYKIIKQQDIENNTTIADDFLNNIKNTQAGVKADLTKNTDYNTAISSKYTKESADAVKADNLVISKLQAQGLDNESIAKSLGKDISYVNDLISGKADKYLELTPDAQAEIQKSYNIAKEKANTDYNQNLADLETEKNRLLEDYQSAKVRQEKINQDNEVNFSRLAGRLGASVGTGIIGAHQNIEQQAYQALSDLFTNFDRGDKDLSNKKIKIANDFKYNNDVLNNTLQETLKDAKNNYFQTVQKLQSDYGLTSIKGAEAMANLTKQFVQDGLNAYKTMNDIKTQNYNNLLNAQKQLLDEDQFNLTKTNTLIDNAKQAILGMSKQDIINYVTSNKLNPSQIDLLESQQAQATVDTLNKYQSGLGDKYASTIQSMLDGGHSPTQVLTAINAQEGTKAEFTTTITSYGGDLTTISKDFRSEAGNYPNQARAKNNNPAGLTYNANRGQALTNAGIQWEIGTARPKNEGGNYISFPNLGEGMKAYMMLWKSPSYQNLTLQQALNRRQTGSTANGYGLSITGSIGFDPNQKVSSMTDEQFNTVVLAQIKRESPGLYKAIQGSVQPSTGTSAYQSLYNEYNKKGDIPSESVLKSMGMTASQFMQNASNSIPMSKEVQKTNDPFALSNTEISETAKEPEKKSKAYADRMNYAVNNLIDAEKEFVNSGIVGQTRQNAAPNAFKSQNQQFLESAKQNFITASLRQESGAAISPTEFEKEEKKYFPQVGDTVETVKAKQKARELAIKSMYNQAGQSVDGSSFGQMYQERDIDKLRNDAATPTTTSNSKNRGRKG